MLENASQQFACNFDVSMSFGTSHRGCTASQRVAGHSPASIPQLLKRLSLAADPCSTASAD